MGSFSWQKAPWRFARRRFEVATTCSILRDPAPPSPKAHCSTAVATSPRLSRPVLFLRRADLLSLCHRHPTVALSILETLARRVRLFAEIVSNLAFRPVSERLARYLSMRAGSVAARTDLELDLTQAQLAARLGTLRELVARAFSQLEESGIITRKRRRIVIRDPARLDALARGEPLAEAARHNNVT
jgi:CRP-like cAMP-binding protein